MKQFLFVIIICLIVWELDAKVTLYKCDDDKPDSTELCESDKPDEITKFNVDGCDGTNCAIAKGNNFTLDITAPLIKVDQGKIKDKTKAYFDLNFEMTIDDERQSFSFMSLNKTIWRGTKNSKNCTNNKYVRDCKDQGDQLFWFKYSFFVPTLTPTGDFRMRITMGNDAFGKIACCKMPGSFKD